MVSTHGFIQVFAKGNTVNENSFEENTLQENTLSQLEDSQRVVTSRLLLACAFLFIFIIAKEITKNNQKQPTKPQYRHVEVSKPGESSEDFYKRINAKK